MLKRRLNPKRAAVARTVRFPERLRQKLSIDADRCGRSFEAQVISILRRHYGENVDLAPPPGDILALATASFSGVEAGDRRILAGRLHDRHLG